jgi:hypothetical protein
MMGLGSRRGRSMAYRLNPEDPTRPDQAPQTREQLEKFILDLLLAVVTGELSISSPITPYRLVQLMKPRDDDGTKPVSLGTVTAIFKSWGECKFIICGTNPVRFQGFNPDFDSQPLDYRTFSEILEALRVAEKQEKVQLRAQYKLDNSQEMQNG